jgi:SAM-dependent methyltransferase
MMQEGLETLRCRSCGAPVTTIFADLGLCPISNAFPRPRQSRAGEVFYPLRAYVCQGCWLVQSQDIETREAHFHADYPYFSSFSSTWLEHARQFAEMAANRFRLGPGSRVVEIGSNDGYLLRHFVSRGIPCLGVDPAENCARAARAHGVETRVAFFGKTGGANLLQEGWSADLIVANNVLAHVPDLNDFVAGIATVLKLSGTATLEFPHLLELIKSVAFDTIYHEHYSYLSLTALTPLFARHGLSVYNVEKFPTHGGSLRLFVHADQCRHPGTAVSALLAEEHAAGLADVGTYVAFTNLMNTKKRELIRLLVELRGRGAHICCYGAAAKGTTLLNYCGFRRDFIDFAVDRNPEKQGRLIPGTGIPILAPTEIAKRKPDYIFILPWNIGSEIMQECRQVKEWGGRFILPMPVPRIVD